MSDKKNKPAFPTIDWNQLDNGQIIIKTDSPGISIRDYFAAKVMQGMLANPDYLKMHLVNDGFVHFEGIAKDANSMADAMLAASEVNPQEPKP